MATIEHAELTTVSPDEVVVAFTTSVEATITTRVGDHEVTTTGRHHLAAVTGLDADTTYSLAVDGAAHDHFFPDSVTTLAVPSGRLLATIATANDVHFGEVECGKIDGVDAAEQSEILTSRPGEPPYPQVMNGAVIDAMRALDPQAVVIKGDLTDTGAPDQYAAFLAAYGALGARMHHVRGNHDAMIDPKQAVNGAPFAVDLDGLTLAVLDTVVPGIDRGQLTADQLAWLDDLAASRSGPVFAFGHHHPWNVEAVDRDQMYFGINPDDSDALIDVFGRRENLVGWFAGHTHRNRVRRFRRARKVPMVEVACTKDYPGCWAEYRIYEGGYVQVVRRAATDAAMDWADRTRSMFFGLYRDYALGALSDRCFTETW